MAKIKRILLECTHTYETDLNTGIQRVVRNIVKNSKHITNEIGIKCQPVSARRSCFIATDQMKYKTSLRAVILSFLKKIYQKLRPVFGIILPFPNLEKFILYGRGRFGLVSIVNLLLDVVLFPAVILTNSRKKIIPRKGDLLLMLDSSWVYPIWPAVKRAKDKGARVGLVVYDVFQITHPQFFTPAIVERFRVWFEQATDNVDFFIAISQTVRDDARRYAESNRPSDKWTGRFESFRLGSVIDNVIRSGEVREELRTVFEYGDKPKTYLTVGTIEPRKNHKYLMDAFDKIWEECPDARMCIVGRTSWLGEEVLKRIRSHPKYSKRLFMFNDLSDTELDYCYRHAKALVYPSHAEGFGLPLVEALYKGLPVLASDIPIFREVGKDFCAYFDITDPAYLAEIIIKIEKEGKMSDVRKPEEYQLPDWKDSCRELLSKTLALYEKV